MRVSITRIDPSLPLPEYHTAGAAGFDLLARLDVDVPPGEIARVPANVIVQVPDGYVLVLALRSSTPQRKGLLSPGGIGVIDRDYCGPADEIHVQVYNFTVQQVSVQRGERIAQCLLVPVVRVEWEESMVQDGASRGGFGTTG